MIEAHWLLFFVASIVVIATPGQDMILVMSKALSQGTRAGVITAAGVSVGLLGHTLLATLGLGALLRTSEWLFVALKFVGAAYLVYLGFQLLLTRSAALTAAASARHSHRQLFMTGAASNISNPRSPSSFSPSCRSLSCRALRVPRSRSSFWGCCLRCSRFS